MKEGRTQQCSYRINSGCRHSHGGLPNKSKVKSIESIVQHCASFSLDDHKDKDSKLGERFSSEKSGSFPTAIWDEVEDEAPSCEKLKVRMVRRFFNSCAEELWNCGLNADNPGCCHSNRRYQMSGPLKVLAIENVGQHLL